MSKGLLKSFAGGEITPELFGRVDLDKFQTALQKASNFWVLPHGPAQNRPAFQYVLEAGNSAKKVRVIPFSYSTTQTYNIELGHLYIRFHTQAGTLLEANKAIVSATKAAQGVLEVTGHGYVTDDWVYINGGDMAELTGRYCKIEVITADTFKIKHLGVRAFAYLDTTAFTTYTAGGTVARVYQIASPYDENDLLALNFTQSADVLSISHPSYDTQELKRLGATNFTLTALSFTPSVATPGAAPGVVTGGPGGGTPTNHYYVSTALKAVTLEESFKSAQSVAANIDLNVAGNYVDITPAAVAGAVRHNIYELKNGLYGYVGQTDGSALRDNNIAPDVSKTPPEAGPTLTGADKRPGCVGYAQGRRIVAGSNSLPQTFNMTRSGTEANMSFSIPTRDDDAIQYDIKAQEVHRIRHVLPLGSLVLLTNGGAWEVSTVNTDVLTPASVWPKQKGTDGASTVRALLAGGAALYVEESGYRLMELSYRQEVDGLALADASILAPHLLEDYKLVDATYDKTNRIAWFAREDGSLLGFTHLPEHKVMAWHQHIAGGSGIVESVSAVKEGAYHALYAVIRRTINGNSVRYIERLADRSKSALEDYFFVDCGATYSGASTTTIGGLWHLQGETVYALANGAVAGAFVVSADGKIVLEDAATKVHVGYRITADFQTLPLIMEQVAAAGQGTLKNIDVVYLRVYKSTPAIYVGPSFDKLRLTPPRTNEPYGSPPALKSDVVRIVIDANWDLTGSVCVRHVDPLPLTILSLVLDSTKGG